MTLLVSFLSALGLMAVCAGVGYLVFHVIDFHLTLMSEIRACKREIERVGRRIEDIPPQQGQ